MKTQNSTQANEKYPWIDHINHPVILLTNNLKIAHSNQAFNKQFDCHLQHEETSLCDYLNTVDGSDAEHLSAFFENNDHLSFSCRFKTLFDEGSRQQCYEAHISVLDDENRDLVFCSLQDCDTQVTAESILAQAFHAQHVSSSLLRNGLNCKHTNVTDPLKEVITSCATLESVKNGAKGCIWKVIPNIDQLVLLTTSGINIDNIPNDKFAYRCLDKNAYAFESKIDSVYDKNLDTEGKSHLVFPVSCNSETIAIVELFIDVGNKLDPAILAHLFALNDTICILLALSESDANSQSNQRSLSSIKLALDHHAMVSTTNAHGIITQVNSNFCDITGYNSSELIGKDHRILKSDQFTHDQAEILWSTISAGDVWSGMICNKKKDGSLFWISSTIVPFMNKSRHIERYIAISNDISANILASEALSKQNAQLEKLNKELDGTKGQLLQQEKLASIGQLAAGIAHEINNPVGYINSNLSSYKKYHERIFALLDCYQSMEDNLASEPADQEKLVEIKSQIKYKNLRRNIEEMTEESIEGVLRVKQIVQDLKDFSRVDEAESQWSNIESGIDSTLNVAANELKYKATVVKEYGGIPDISCVPSQINQVILNILVNAAQAMDKSGAIIIRTAETEKGIRIEIEDNGPGMPDSVKEKIFDPFFTTKEIGKGTGLGLSLSYGIIAKHKGSITVESELGLGTTFIIELPRGDDDIPSEEEAVMAKISSPPIPPQNISEQGSQMGLS